jgi:hypothetical protein
MKRMWIMAASAIVLALAGLAATFAPHELLEYLGAASDGALPLLVQITGALYLAFAMLNWTAKDSLIGGIYNRPVAIGNFLHFVMGALALGKAAVAMQFLLPVAAVYTLFAIAFAWVMFTSPVQRAAP